MRKVLHNFGSSTRFRLLRPRASIVHRPRGPTLTHPPLLILFSVHNDHIPLRESQFVRVVSHAVVERFDSLGL